MIIPHLPFISSSNKASLNGKQNGTAPGFAQRAFLDLSSVLLYYGDHEKKTKTARPAVRFALARVRHRGGAAAEKGAAVSAAVDG